MRQVKGDVEYGSSKNMCNVKALILSNLNIFFRSDPDDPKK